MGNAWGGSGFVVDAVPVEVPLVGGQGARDCMGGCGIDIDGVSDLGDIGTLDPGEGLVELAADGLVDEVADLVGSGSVGGGASAGGDQRLEAGGVELSGVNTVDTDRVHVVGNLSDGGSSITGFRLRVAWRSVTDDDDDLLNSVASFHINGLHDTAVDAGVGVSYVSSFVIQRS